MSTIVANTVHHSPFNGWVIASGSTVPGKGLSTRSHIALGESRCATSFDTAFGG